MTRWGEVRPGDVAIWLLKFMLFFGIEPVYAVLLLIFGLFYVIYQRPSVYLQCSTYFTYICNVFHVLWLGLGVLRVIYS